MNRAFKALAKPYIVTSGKRFRLSDRPTKPPRGDHNSKKLLKRGVKALSEMQAADVSKIDCPVLLVTGDEDAVAPPQAVRGIAERIAGAQVEVLARCGHWTTYEKPEECSELLRRFHMRLTTATEPRRRHA